MNVSFPWDDLLEGDSSASHIKAFFYLSTKPLDYIIMYLSMSEEAYYSQQRRFIIRTVLDLGRNSQSRQTY